MLATTFCHTHPHPPASSVSGYHHLRQGATTITHHRQRCQYSVTSAIPHPRHLRSLCRLVMARSGVMHRLRWWSAALARSWGLCVEDTHGPGYRSTECGPGRMSRNMLWPDQGSSSHPIQATDTHGQIRRHHRPKRILDGTHLRCPIQRWKLVDFTASSLKGVSFTASNTRWSTH